MMKNYIKILASGILAVLLLSSCYDDKGNYNYRELTALKIDTAGKAIQPEMTAYQFKRFRLEPDIQYAGDKADLSYEWRLYLQKAELPEGVYKYDSAKLLSTAPVLDTVLYDMPENYYLTLSVYDRSNDTREFMTIKLKIESELSRGICLLEEKDGRYDLSMIKSTLLDEGLTEAEDQPMRELFSQVNGKYAENGRFLAQYKKVLYLFTGTGGYKLDNSTFKVTTDDYSSFFGFSLGMTFKPGTYLYVTNYEVLVNDSKLHMFNHAPYQEGSAFGDIITGAWEYTAEPFLTKIASQECALAFFDSANHRFAALDKWCSQVIAYESTTGDFDVNNIDKDLVYMANGYNGVAAVFKDRNAENYYLYLADLTQKAAVAKKIYNMDQCAGLNSRSLFAFGTMGSVVFYAAGNQLCQYSYSTTNKGESVYPFASGEEITGMQIFTNSGHALDGKLLMVATYDGQEGRVYLMKFDEQYGTIDKGSVKCYKGFGRIVNMLYKE